MCKCALHLMWREDNKLICLAASFGQVTWKMYFYYLSARLRLHSPQIRCCSDTSTHLCDVMLWSLLVFFISNQSVSLFLSCWVNSIMFQCYVVNKVLLPMGVFRSDRTVIWSSQVRKNVDVSLQLLFQVGDIGNFWQPRLLCMLIFAYKHNTKYSW